MVSTDASNTGCAMANWLLATGQKRRVGLTSTAWKCWQYDGGVLYKSPGWSLLEAPLHSGSATLGMGSAQLAFTESNACAGQVEPGSRHAILEQCPLGRVDAPPTNGSQNLGDLRQGRDRTLCLRRQLSLPNLFFEGQGCVGPRLAQPPPLLFSPDRPDPTGNQANQGTEAQGSVSGPALEEPTLVHRAASAALCSPVAHPPETGPPLSGEQNNMAPMSCGLCTFGLSMGACGPPRERAKYNLSG